MECCSKLLAISALDFSAIFYSSRWGVSAKHGPIFFAANSICMLQQMIEQGEIPQPVTYSTRLIERASTSL